MSVIKSVIWCQRVRLPWHSSLPAPCLIAAREHGCTCSASYLISSFACPPACLQPEAEDFVVATGRTTTVRAFCEMAFAYAGMPLKWEGVDLQEVCFTGG